MFGFILGREYKLSIAEIFSVFPEGKTVFFDKELLILEGLGERKILEKSNYLGGTIKIIKIGNFDIVEDALKHEGKFKYGINVYGEPGKLKEILNKSKKDLKNAGISSRFVNKDFKNLTSAQIIGEKLIEKESDYNEIFLTEKFLAESGKLKVERKMENHLIGKTIWIQDINAYSKRDFGKQRDMKIGMLPPKLAQIMINLGKNDNISIFDPFVGLGTILIEAGLMGFVNLYGSDLSEKMVEYAKKNLASYSGLTRVSFGEKKQNNKSEHYNTGLQNFDNKRIIGAMPENDSQEYAFEKLNAKFIEESKFINKTDLIVTEGYLGEIMTQKNISLERINKQKESFKPLYEKFFAGLKKVNYSGIIVISFPFWELNGKYIYANEIYEILEKYCIIENLFPNNFENLATKVGSLLYKRKNQFVGREIFKLEIKF